MRSLFITLFVGISAIVLGQYPAQNHYTLINQYIESSLAKTESEIEYRIVSSTGNDDIIQHYYGIQTLFGNDILGTEFNIAIKNNVVVSLNHHFLVTPLNLLSINVYKTSASRVLQQLVGDYGIDQEEVKWMPEGYYSYVNQQLSDLPIRIYKKWYLKNTDLIPVYEVSLYEKNHSHWYITIIDASKFEILRKTDWVQSCNTSADVFKPQKSYSKPIKDEINQETSSNANSGYRVFARPVESPKHGNRTLEEDPHDDDASPYGWHDINGVAGAEFTITRGNNVYASEDKNNDNVAGYSPNGGSSLSFDYDFDITKSAALYTDAAITNLFYWNNVMHDVWWHYGFDEESGNFQQNNYGRGGIGGDFVNADAQDGSGLNNANFATPPDGQNPRMQMFLWSSSNTSDHFQVNSPSFAAGKYASTTATFGPVLTSNAVTGNLVLVNSGGANSRLGCSTFQNSTDVSGKIALIERGTCTFVEKVKNAQNAGAIGVVIYNNVSTNPIRMNGTDLSLTIPSVMIGQNDGQYIRGLLSTQTVSVSLFDSSLADANTFDSDFDNGVIAHEYGHGISVRLTGGALNSGCLSNEEQMGEGWSDFFALVMTHQDSATANDLRGIGTYVANEEIDGNGIRTYPYSVDISKSPYTYNNIKTFSVPHGVGSVWCSMLWDMYWALIEEYGYDKDIYNGTGGNNIAMQLVIDGLKLQPCGPGFVDGRDAILLADRLRYNGANQKLIWEVFARRGLGYNADQGASSSRSDGTSAFNLPPFLLGELIVSKSAPVESANNENLAYQIKVYNRNEFTISDITLRDTLQTNVKIDEESLVCNAVYENGVITISIDSIVSGDSFICTYTVIPNLENTSTTIWKDDVESGAKQWKATTITGNNGWIITTGKGKSGTSSWFAPNESTSSDYYLSGTIDVSGIAPALSFWHWYNTEELWDGGIVEYKLPTGPWTDTEPFFILNGYNGTIQTNPQSTISDRKAFTGNSKQFINTKIDLSAFAGSSIEIRFRLASDGAAAEEGWYIDDITLEEVESVSNFVQATYNDKVSRAGTLTFITGNGNVSSVEDKSVFNDLEIYPNPVENTLYFNWSGKERFTIKLFDITGKLLWESKVDEATVINVQHYISGVYIAEVSAGNEIMRKKIIKQ